MLKTNFEGPAKLHKIFPALSYLNYKFQKLFLSSSAGHFSRWIPYIMEDKFLNLFLPGQNISVDESLILWTGCLSFKQYLPLKAAKFGVKTLIMRILDFTTFFTKKTHFWNKNTKISLCCMYNVNIHYFLNTGLIFCFKISIFSTSTTVLLKAGRFGWEYLTLCGPAI